MKLFTGEGWAGEKDVMALKEIESNKEPLPDTEQVYVELFHATCLLSRPPF